MTVTSIARSAYRTRLTGRWHLSLQDSMMKPNAISVLLCAIVATSTTLACAPAPVTPAPEPANAPRPAPPQPTPVSPVAGVQIVPSSRTGSWNFGYAPGTYTYDVTTDAVVAPLADTTQKRQFPETHRKATITLSANGDVQVVDPVAVSAAGLRLELGVACTRPAADLEDSLRISALVTDGVTPRRPPAAGEAFQPNRRR